jgi:periplasmic protein TonB
VHVLVISFQAIHTPEKEVEIKPNPINIKYIPNKEIKAEESPGEVVNIPEPEKSEKPEETDLLSNANSRAHSDQNQTEIKEYSRKKRIAPKKSGVTVEKQEQTKPIPKVEEKKPEPEPESELKGSEFLSPEEMTPAEEIPESTTFKGLTALLDGIDPEKYASSDTLNPLEPEADDGESISLNTKEVKYASYFARVKHQIERVWSYPLEAAQKGIQGNVDLRFIISKDGSLKGVWVKDSSREEILDVAAIKAVQDAAPFYPFPLSIQREKLSIIATFVYSPRFRHARSND